MKPLLPTTLLPLLALSLLLAACESRADKLKRLCSVLNAVDPPEKEKVAEEITKLSGAKDVSGAKGLYPYHFCNSYLH